VAPPVFKTGLAANIVAGGFDSLPPPPPIPAGRMVKRQLRPMKVFSILRVARLSIAAAALLVTGCAPMQTQLVVQIRYLPQANVQPIPGADSVTLAVQVKDLRNDPADIGTIVTRSRTLEIVTNDNLAEAVRSAIQIELQNRGFKIGQDSGAVLVSITGVDAERRIGWFYGNSGRTVILMTVKVAQKGGRIVYSHYTAGERGLSDIDFSSSVGTAERETNLALQDCIQHLFADPKFIDALLKADKP
jgi:uncharacterized lipoprotein YajG